MGGTADIYFGSFRSKKFRPCYSAFVAHVISHFSAKLKVIKSSACIICEVFFFLDPLQQPFLLLSHACFQTQSASQAPDVISVEQRKAVC